MNCSAALRHACIVVSLNRQELFATWYNNPTWYNNQVHSCCNIAVQFCYFIIPWQHVLSWMNNAVDLSWWFQQRCSSLFVHQAMNTLFQHAWTSLSTTLFKLASSTMSKHVNRQKQVVPFLSRAVTIVCNHGCLWFEEMFPHT